MEQLCTTQPGRSATFLSKGNSEASELHQPSETCDTNCTAPMKVVTPPALLPGVQPHGENRAERECHIRVHSSLEAAIEIVFQTLPVRELASIRKENTNQSV